MAKTKKPAHEGMSEVLQDVNAIVSKQLQYAQDSKKMFDEEEESKFYLSIVFQSDTCCAEFLEKFQDFLGIRDGNQIFVNGHELARKWNKPLTSAYVSKTVDINKLRDGNLISQVGVLEE